MDTSLFSDRSIQLVADNKIRAAYDAGEFDNLPGFGQPSALIDEPYDPNWWIRRKLQRENLQISVLPQSLVEGFTAARRRSAGNS